MDDFNAVRFENKKEILELLDGVETYPIGHLLFSVLDIDWIPYIDEVEKTLNLIVYNQIKEDLTISERMRFPKRAPYFIAARFYRWFNHQMLEDSPVLYHLFSSQTLLYYKKIFLDRFNIINFNDFADADQVHMEAKNSFYAKHNYIKSFGEPYKAVGVFQLFFDKYPDYPDGYLGFENTSDKELIDMVNDFLYQINKLLITLNNFKKDIEVILDQIFDAQNGQTVHERFQQLLTGQPQLFKNYFTDDYSIHFKNKMHPEGFSFAFFSSDIASLAFLELKYICMNNIEMKKCAHCGRYFIPFSSSALYCGRIANRRTKKTCKEVASMEKYSSKINSDSAKRFYRRQANAYQMRCRRLPALYPRQDYEKWKERSKKLLAQCEAGKISLEDFQSAVRIIDKK